MDRRVWKINKAGDLDRLRLVSESLAPPGPGEARISVRAVGLNFADIFATLGLYSATPKGEFTPGLEFAGVIEAIGPARGKMSSAGSQSGKKSAKKTGKKKTAKTWKVGDRIMGVTRFGGYASRINVDTRYLRPLPRGWDFAQGAALPGQGLTAWYALKELGAVKPNDVVLVHSAAGGVGLLAMAMLEKLGCKAVATVGREEKVKFLADRTGIDPELVIVRDEKSYARRLDEALQRLDAPGFNIILDAVAGPYFQPGFERLVPTGRLVLFGAADFMPTGTRPNYLKLAWRWLKRPRLDPVEMISDNRSVMAFNLIWLWDKIEELEHLFTDIDNLKLDPPHVGHHYPFDNALEAMKFFKTGRTVGKVVLDVEEE